VMGGHDRSSCSQAKPPSQALQRTLQGRGGCNRGVSCAGSLSSQVRLLVVVHAHREDDRVVRIISPRRAKTCERAQYRESNSP